MAVSSHARTRDVIVVGGGPAGSATATWLARRGCDVMLVDRARFPRPKPCAEYFSPGTVAALARLGALDRLGAETGRVLRGMQLRAPSGARCLLQYHDARAGLAVPRETL